MSVRAGGAFDWQRAAGQLLRQCIEPVPGGMWRLECCIDGWSWIGGARRVVSEWRTYRTLYGARMAARQARIDYSPGGRLYEGVTK